jgi:hypothetical protein
MNKHTNTKLVKGLLFSASSLVLAGTLISALPVSAEYKPDLKRNEDNLSLANSEAVYNYNYENTSPDAAPGYFELSLEKLTGSDPSTLLEVKSITETTPFNLETKKAGPDAKTTEFKISDAVYTENGSLKIRLSPQSECVKRAEGGCANGLIPSSSPSRISIKVGLKTGASLDPSVIYGNGRIYFPEGFDINQIGWKINVGGADEAKVQIPAIKEDKVNPEELATNATLLAQQENPTKSDAVSASNTGSTNPNNQTSTQAPTQAPTQTPAPKTQEPAKSVDLAQQTDQKSAENKNNTTPIIFGGLGILILAGLGSYMLLKHKKSKKS